LNRRRELDANRSGLEEFDFYLGAGYEVVHRVAKCFVVEGDLIVGLGVHEMVHVSIRVEVLHFMFFEHRALDVFGRAERHLSRRAASKAAQLCLYKRSQIAGRAMLKVQDAMRRSVVDNDHSTPNIIGLHYSFLLEFPSRTRLSDQTVGPQCRTQLW